MRINSVWDRISKSLICLVDAWLNWYFLKNVRVRLVEEAGLMKYQPLVDFNTKLMVLSVLSDVSILLDMLSRGQRMPSSLGLASVFHFLPPANNTRESRSCSSA